MSESILENVIDSDATVELDESTMSMFYFELENALRAVADPSILFEDGEFTEKEAIEVAHMPMMIIGGIGIGKTAGIKGIINRLNATVFADRPDNEKLGFKCIVLGGTIVGELNGVPVITEGGIQRVMTDDLPVLDRGNGEGDPKYGVLFLDEITTGDVQQIQPALGLCDSRRGIGSYTLPDGWIVVAAGNGSTWGNFVRLDLATRNRVEYYSIPTVDYEKDWKKYALQHDIMPQILSFLDTYPEEIYNVDLEVQNADDARMMATPRSWSDFSNQLRKKAKIMGLERVISNERGCIPIDYASQVAGKYLGREVAESFRAFLTVISVTEIKPGPILDGTDKGADYWYQKVINEQGTFKVELMNNIIEQCQHQLLLSIKKNERMFITGKGLQDLIKNVANVCKWFIGFDKYNKDFTLTALAALTGRNISGDNTSIACDKYEDPSALQKLQALVTDRRVLEQCPEMKAYYADQDNIDLAVQANGMNYE